MGGTGSGRKLVLKLGRALLAAVVIRRTLAVVGLLDPSVVSIGHKFNLPQNSPLGQLNRMQEVGCFFTSDQKVALGAGGRSSRRRSIARSS